VSGSMLLVGGVTAGAGKAFSLWRAGMIGGEAVERSAAAGRRYERTVEARSGLRAAEYPRLRAERPSVCPTLRLQMPRGDGPLSRE